MIAVDEMERELLRNHLCTQYANVFDDKMIEQHISDYIDTSAAERLVQRLRSLGLEGGRLLDIGSGYGSTVLTARMHGIDAAGVELADFEVAFARDRLRKIRPEDRVDDVYRQGDALALPFPDRSFDVVTLSNVLEHVPDYRRALAEAVRVLRPGGCLYAVCPNYAAFRREAHYLVPWFPLLPRPLANIYLRMSGRNPGFFQHCIYYTTNWGILAALLRLPVIVRNPSLEKIKEPDLIGHEKIRAVVRLMRSAGLTVLVRMAVTAWFLSPVKPSVEFYAVKRDIQ